MRVNTFLLQTSLSIFQTSCTADCFDQTIIGIKLPLDVNQKTESHLHKIHSFWMQSQFLHQFSLSAQLNLLLQVHTMVCTSAPLSKQPSPPRWSSHTNPLSVLSFFLFTESYYNHDFFKSCLTPSTLNLKVFFHNRCGLKRICL